jgi:hypothetical protein
MTEPERDEVALVSVAEAVAEVRRWLEVEEVDPEGIFTAAGEQTVRYRDLIGHLTRGTPDGELLRFAISRGRAMRQERPRAIHSLLQIAPPAAAEPARAFEADTLPESPREP